MIHIEHVGQALHVLDTEDGDTILLDLVPLAPGDDVDEAVAVVSEQYSADQD
jgi:hypothetical protein